MNDNHFPEQEEDLLTMMRRWEQESKQEAGGGEQGAGEPRREAAARPEPGAQPPSFAAAESLLRDLERFESTTPPPAKQPPARQAMPAPPRPIPPLPPPPAQQAMPPREPFRNPWAAPPAPMPPPPAPRQGSGAAQAADAWHRVAEPRQQSAKQQGEPAARQPQNIQNPQGKQNTRSAQNAQSAQNPQKKRKHPVRRFFRTLLVILLLLGIGGYTLVFLAAGNVTHREILPADAKAIAAYPSRMTVTNILLIGVDGAGPSSRSDTMLLLSIDRAHGKLKLTSFLRDTWVDLPGGGQDRLNAACSRGGAPAAMRAVAENFHVRIDHYVLLNFSKFKKVVDALGGVDVPVTDKEIKFICDTTRRGKAIGAEKMRQEMAQKGAVHMDGELALIFVRIRKLDSDLERTQRQRILLESLVRKCKTNPLLWAKLVQNVLPEIETDMSQFALANLAMGAPIYIQFKVEQHQVPANGTWNYANKNGASVIAIKNEECWKLNRDQLRTFIEAQ